MEDGGWWVGTGWGSREPTHVRPGVQTGVGPDAVRRELRVGFRGPHSGGRGARCPGLPEQLDTGHVEEGTPVGDTLGPKCL